ncbi:MAG: imidazoleglycerol-phosphate dehydratase HisB [Planctomycetota bacterium]
MTTRHQDLTRATRETRISIGIDLDTPSDPDITTGVGFLDHMLSSFALHARLGLRLSCEGDLHIDDHHSAEDSAIALGSAIDGALGDRAGIERFGDSLVPMDEALCRCAVDLSGRPHATVSLGLTRDALGGLACENIEHFFQSLAVASRSTLHIDVLRGSNDHHRAEAAFKAFAVAFRRAIAPSGVSGVPSAKGVL